jgi:hypothetical protein
LDSGFRWAFVQYDDRGTRVTEIALPDIAVNWRQLLSKGLLEIGHNTDSSPFITTTSKDPTIGAETITRALYALVNISVAIQDMFLLPHSKILARDSFGNLYQIPNHRTMTRGLHLIRRNMTVSMLWTLTTKLTKLNING